MDLVSEIFAFIAVMAATWFVFQFVGIRRDSLFYTRDEKRQLDIRIAGRLGNVATILNIFGTLTSLAAVYVFFIGTSKLFGAFTFFCAVASVFGAVATNYFTNRVVSQPHVRTIYGNGLQVSGALPYIFWRDEPNGILNAGLIRLISMVSVAGIVWLEFAVFADLTGLVNFPGTHGFHAAAFFFSSLGVVYFVVKFGLRGFVFADLLQAPLIAASSFIVLAAIAVGVILDGQVSLSKMLTPVVSGGEVLLFIIHVMIINSFFVLVTEGHWMRVWLFGDRETTFQIPAIGATSFGWILLIAIGLLSGSITAQVGDHGVSDVVRFVSDRFPFISIAFWIAAVCALFSTADANIFAFLMVKAFCPKDGKFNSRAASRPVRPFVVAFFFSLAGSALYYMSRTNNIPIEKLVFVCVPFCLNILPSMVALAFGRKPRFGYTAVSCVGYMAVSAYGLSQERQEIAVTLAAVCVPLIVAIAARLFSPKQ